MNSQPLYVLHKYINRKGGKSQNVFGINGTDFLLETTDEATLKPSIDGSQPSDNTCTKRFGIKKHTKLISKNRGSLRMEGRAPQSPV